MRLPETTERSKPTPLEEIGKILKNKILYQYDEQNTPTIPIKAVSYLFQNPHITSESQYDAFPPFFMDWYNNSECPSTILSVTHKGLRITQEGVMKFYTYASQNRLGMKLQYPDPNEAYALAHSISKEEAADLLNPTFTTHLDNTRRLNLLTNRLRIETKSLQLTTEVAVLLKLHMLQVHDKQTFPSKRDLVRLLMKECELTEAKAQQLIDQSYAAYRTILEIDETP